MILRAPLLRSGLLHGIAAFGFFAVGGSCFVVCFASTGRAEQLISESQSWRYFKGTTFPGANWTKQDFDDSKWSTGPSGFGYGDGDDQTVLDDMSDNYFSIFTRKQFDIPDPVAIKHLTLAVDYDDGFVAYINGVEVARRNIAQGPVSNTTPALQEHEASRGDAESNPQEKELIGVDPKLLVRGSNVIAVSGHNVKVDSSDLSLIVELYTNVTLTRGPFVQMPNERDVTIVWRTDALTDSVVEYGSDARCKDGRVSIPALTREHTVTIMGLPVGKSYFYRVRSEGITLSEGNSLLTKRRDNEPFRFAVIGDWGTGNDAMRNVARQVEAANVDFILTVGDNVYDSGQPGFYDRCLAAYARTIRRVPMFPTLGDHDIMSDKGNWMLKYFRLPQNGPKGLEGRNYSFDYGNAHFVAIDSTAFEIKPIDPEATAAIKNWLFKDLAATHKPWKFLYMHNPPFTSESVHREAYNVRTQLLPIAEAAGVKMLFAGHNHFFERLNAINGVHHIITGAGGRVLYKVQERRPKSAIVNDEVHSFTLVEVNGGTLTLRQIDESGKQLDEFHLDIGQ